MAPRDRRQLYSRCPYALEDLHDDESFKNGVCETFKYALKFNDLKIGEQVHAFEVLRGRRLIFSYGCLRGVNVPDSLVDDIDSRLALEPWMDILYRFVNSAYAVRRTDCTGKMADEYLIWDS
ncbi:MAG: hypothetical protein GY820_28615 [Gammaproteobacteria bacterium]|nr:hypothetical protein [Gammaproteobacteria bacterium]